MIDLGLARSYALLSALGSPQNYFKAFHVAGTNGKGSVASYLSTIFVTHGIITGKFTSPHLITENDGICINDVPISMEKYREVGAYVRKLDQQYHIGATEFETQTAIAFEIFRRAHVTFAVVEVGLGGLLDATNVLSAANVLCTAITKISLDHEQFLGSNVREIAKQKAGIMKYGVNCVVDNTNDPEIKQVLSECAADRSAPIFFVDTLLPALDGLVKSTDLLLGDFQVQNAAVAAKVASFVHVPAAIIATGLKNTKWKGRLEWIEYKNTKLLVDGAHNHGSAVELAKYVRKTISGPITWVVAFSKPCDVILPLLVKEGDTVICTKFGPVDNMPWINAQDPENIAKVAKNLTQSVEVVVDVVDAGLEHRTNVVVCGSLYLLKDILAAGGK